LAKAERDADQRASLLEFSGVYRNNYTIGAIKINQGESMNDINVDNTGITLGGRAKTIGNKELPKVMVETILIIVLCMLTGFSYLNYQTLSNQLLSNVLNQRNLIESVAVFDVQHSQNAHKHGSVAATLSQILAAQENNHRTLIGVNVETMIAEKRGNKVIIFVSNRALDPKYKYRTDGNNYGLVGSKEHFVDSSSANSFIFLESLKGRSGVQIGKNYNDRWVIAGFTTVWIADIPLALVQSINLSALMVPTGLTLLITGFVALCMIIWGSRRFLERIYPLIDALEERDRYNEVMLDNSPSGVVKINNDGNIILFNKTAECLFGYSSDQILGKSINTLISPDMTEQVGKNRDCIGRRKDETTFPMHLSVGKIKTSKGKSSTYLGIITDLQPILKLDNERIQAIEEKEEKTATLTTIINNSLDPIILMDCSGRVVEFNPAAERVFGYKKDEILNQLAGDYMVPEELKERHRADLRKYLKTGVGTSFNKRIQLDAIRKGGQRFPIEMVISPAVTNKGIQFSIIITDFSERNEKELQLIDVSQKMERTAIESTQLIETANAPIFGIDTAGNINEWNQSVIRLTDYTKEEVIGQNLVDKYITEEHQASVKQILDDALEGKETTNYEVPLFTRSGTRLMLLLNATTRRDTDGNITGVVGVGQDISEIKTAYEELEKERVSVERKVLERTQELLSARKKAEYAEKIKTEFLSTAAHELRTPLTSIRGFSEVLVMRKNLSDATKKKYMQFINTNAENLGLLINDLLDLSKLESGQNFVLDRTNISIDQLVKVTIENFQAHINNHSFTTDLERNIPRVFADKGKIHRVLENLVSNAIKYSPKGGNIEIIGKISGEVCHITVRDQGLGMTPDQVEHIFEKFYRADASNSAIEGTGLGMTITKNIVEAHGGKIWVESEYGAGTTVHFTLPLNPCAEQRGESEATNIVA
jgi:PAS domain S-box-containing protein